MCRFRFGVCVFLTFPALFVDTGRCFGDSILDEYRGLWVSGWEVGWQAGDAREDVGVGALNLMALEADLRLGQREVLSGTNLIPSAAQGKRWILIDAAARFQWPRSGTCTCSVRQQPDGDPVGIVATAESSTGLAGEEEVFRFISSRGNAVFIQINGRPIELPPGTGVAGCAVREGENVLGFRALLEQCSSLEVRISSHREEDVVLAELERRVSDPDRSWAGKVAAWNAVAQVHRFNGHLTDAAEALEKAAAVERSQEAKYLRWMEIADLYAAAGGPHYEAEALQSAVELIPSWDPRHWPTATRLATRLGEFLGRIEEAIEFLQQVRDAHGADTAGPDILLQLTRIYLNAGMTEEALRGYRDFQHEFSARGFEDAIKKGLDLCRMDRINKPILPARVEASNGLALYFQKSGSGQWSEAFTQLETILENYPEAVIESSVIGGRSVREEIERELSRLGPEAAGEYVRTFEDALLAALRSGDRQRLERFRFAHPLPAFEGVVDQAIADLLLEEGNPSRAAAFYERAATAVRETLATASARLEKISTANLGEATLDAKAAFSRCMAGETIAHNKGLRSDDPEQKLIVAGQETDLGQLAKKWSEERSERIPPAGGVTPVSDLTVSRLPLLRAPLIFRKWQTGWIPHGPHDMPRLAGEFVPYVPCGDRNTVFFNTSEILHAVDPQQGRLLWTRGPSEAFFADPPPRSLKEISLGAVGKRFYAAFSDDAVFYRLNWAHRSTDERRSIIFAARRSDGTLLWSTAGYPEFEGLEFTSDPAYADGTVVVAGWQTLAVPTFFLVGLDARSGELLWKTHLFSGTPFPWIRDDGFVDTPMGASPPTVDGKVAYYPSGAGVIAAVDILDGSILWLSGYPRLYAWGPDDLGGKVFLSKASSPPAVSGDVVLVAPQDSHLLLFMNRHTGAELNRIESPSLRALIGVDEDRAYVQMGTGVAAYRVEDASKEWRTEIPVSAILGVPSLSPRGVVCTGWEGLFVLERTTGDIVEQRPWGHNEAFGNPLDLGDRLIGASHASVHLLAQDSKLESEWWLPRTAETKPVMVTVPSREGKLIRWILPVVDRGDFHFDPDAPDLLLLRASDSVEMRLQGPVPSLLWETGTFTYPNHYQFNEETLVLARGRELHVIDAKSGGNLWRKIVGDIEEENFSGAFPDGDEVFGYAGEVAVAYSRGSGERLWRALFPGRRVRGIRSLGDRVGLFVEFDWQDEHGAERGEAIVVDRRSGTVLCSIPIVLPRTADAGVRVPCPLMTSHKAGDTSGAALDEVLVDQRYLARVDWQTGAVRFGPPLSSTVGCPSGRLQHHGHYIASEGENGEMGVLWERDSLRRIRLPAATRWCIRENVFYYAADQRIHAYDLEREKPVWDSRPFKQRVEAIAVSEDAVLAALRDTDEKGPGAGQVIALDRDSGLLRERTESLTAYYHKSGGFQDRLYTSDYTYLYCFGAPKKAEILRSEDWITLAEKKPDPGAIAGLKTAADIEDQAASDLELNLLSARIDGDLAEWANASWTRLGGAEDWHPDHVHQSQWKNRMAEKRDEEWAEVAVAEDLEGVFFAVRVHDDVHTAPPRRSLWRGDSLLVTFLPAPSPVQLPPMVYTIALVDGIPCAVRGAIHQPLPAPVDHDYWSGGLWSLFEGGTVAWARAWKAQAENHPQQAPIQAAIVRNDAESETIYELRIPRAVMPQGGETRWDVAVQDNDGNGRRGCLQLASGVWSVEDPRGYARWPARAKGESR